MLLTIRYRARRLRTAAALLVIAALAALTVQPVDRALVGPRAPELSAYVLPDGTVPVLCSALGHGDGGEADATHCPLCIPAKVTAILAPQVLLVGANVTAALVQPVTYAPAPRCVRRTPHQPRAPPGRG
ncbi:MAG: hypothetical protein AAFQ45_12615 [Pseudomonadota bacterium]